MTGSLFWTDVNAQLITDETDEDSGKAMIRSLFLLPVSETACSAVRRPEQCSHSDVNKFIENRQWPQLGTPYGSL